MFSDLIISWVDSFSLIIRLYLTHLDIQTGNCATVGSLDV